MTPFADDYLPISAYGAIGNLRTVALVGLNGSIDWCCLPVIDSPAVFAAILDRRHGGRFRVSAARPNDVEQEYIPHTNVLKTIFNAEGGILEVTDFMPVKGSLEVLEPHSTRDEIHRILEAIDGDVEVEVEWIPRFDFARATPAIEHTPTGVVAHADDAKLSLGGLPDRGDITSDEFGPMVRSTFTLRAGQRMALVMRWGSTDTAAALDLSDKALTETTASWKDWALKEEATGDRAWAGYWNEHVIRSELALKLMTFAPTGAIAAAPTTSLPEWIGGQRNWDYRYSWIRDAGLAAQALNAMGHVEESGAFIRWAERVSRSHAEDEAQALHIMYDVRGNVCLPERELDHLEGYRGSTPVRIGNMAAEQVQHDIYGDLITSAYEYVRMGRELDADIWAFLSHVADRATVEWQDEDDGIWEFRKGPWHFVYSKVMIWIALQRACVLAARGYLKGDVARWQEAQRIIKADILAKGYDPDQNAFTFAYGEKDLDAANLLIPLREFLEFEDPRVQGTIDRTLERLTTNDLVYRYHTDDGLGDPEGAFVLCTFWMVDALALSGRLDEAYRIFDNLAGRVNHVGLLSEQIDPSNGEFLGNFPQAFSHIGLINSALYLAHMEGRETPIPDPIGTKEHRRNAQRALENPIDVLP